MSKPRRSWLSVFFCALLAVIITSCSAQEPPTKPTAQDKALKRVQTRQNYVPKNDVEGRNYNARLQIADDPATLWWCSVYPTNPNVKPFTVPITGKLTSGNKRPYPTSRDLAGGNDGVIRQDYYTTELPGPDGFFGSSGEYRYGFDPAGNYHDFYNMETYCTTVPNVIQKNTTQIAITVSGDLNTLDRQAQAALKVCRDKDPDPSTPCDAAAQILGVS